MSPLLGEFGRAVVREMTPVAPAQRSSSQFWSAPVPAVFTERPEARQSGGRSVRGRHCRSSFCPKVMYHTKGDRGPDSAYVDADDEASILTSAPRVMLTG